MRWCFLGRVEYDSARRMQTRLAEMRARGGIDDLLLLLEHPPVLTVGRNASVPEGVERPDRPVVRTDRGGDVTYHGPGQLIGYPVCQLPSRGRGVRSFVSAVEQALCDVALSLGIGAMPRAGYPGVWSTSDGEAPRKLASIGLGVRRAVTLHGFALNVDERAERGFDGIAPCGLVGVKVTSLASLRRGPMPDLEAVAARVARGVAVRTEKRWVPKPLDPAELPVDDTVSSEDGRSDGERPAEHTRTFLLG
ncbi:MAG: lipoyl(octanoyl) transferase LipB [Candidatus Binatia bacterium]|nr:lipoyl(octanoyl) transferase LipB [Candidatus Binatia bacterium]